MSSTTSQHTEAATTDRPRWVAVGRSTDADAATAGAQAAEAALDGAGRRADFEQGSLTCIAEVPQGALMWPMEGDADSVLDATDGACADALDSLGGRQPVGLVAFDCIARGIVLDQGQLREEVDRISRGAGGAPVGGFYSYGEISRTRGITGFNNQTLVVLAVS